MARMTVRGIQMARLLAERQGAGGFEDHEGAEHDVADDHHDEIGGEVVGAVVVEDLAAMLALLDRLDEGGKQTALAAVGAFAEEAARHRRP